MPTWPLLTWLSGCEDGPEPFVPACVTEALVVEVAPPDGDFASLADGDPLFCGIPPQGGAPYTPWRFRLTGPEAVQDGIVATVTATDLETGEVLGDTEVQLGVVCANAGESTGFFTGAEVHLRYEGHTVEDLDGRDAEIRFEVGPADRSAPPGAAVHRVSLDCP